MQLSAPCAPIRNEATLLAAAAVALPDALETPIMVAYAQQIRQICWHSILHSSAENPEPFGRLDDNTLHSGVQGSGERQSSKAYGSSLEGHNGSVSLRSGHHAQTPTEHASTPAQSAGVQQPDKPSLQHSGLQSVHSDAADPMMSLWLKNVTLLFFGHDLRQHLVGRMSSNNQGTHCSLREDKVQMVLKSGNYDVRAACLKALVRRTADGTFLSLLLYLCYYMGALWSHVHHS